MENFAHLHVHTQYSVLDGTNKMDALCQRVKNLGMEAVAVTDHGTLHGLIEFQKAAKKAGIKPILGVEAYVTADPDGLPKGERTQDNKHCVLLAQNNQGLKNLIWMVNQANMHNFYYKPRIWRGHFHERAEGLIATSACLAGVVAKGTRTNKHGVVTCEGAEYDEENKRYNPTIISMEWFRKMKLMFNGRFYLEVQDNPMWEQQAWNDWAISASKEYDVPLVITSDAHYLGPDDKVTHELIMAQQLGFSLAQYREQGGMKYTGKYFIREPRDMWKAALAMNAQGAYINTTEIASQCNAEIELGEMENPSWDPRTSDDYHDFKEWLARREEDAKVTSDGARPLFHI